VKRFLLSLVSGSIAALVLKLFTYDGNRTPILLTLGAIFLALLGLGAWKRRKNAGPA
jgi:LPXTG-motif cell wall-anchored protein